MKRHELPIGLIDSLESLDFMRRGYPDDSVNRKILDEFFDNFGLMLKRVHYGKNKRRSSGKVIN